MLAESTEHLVLLRLGIFDDNVHQCVTQQLSHTKKNPTPNQKNAILNKRRFIMRVLFLLFVLVVGLFGEKPYVYDKSKMKYYDAVLAKDGKTFYTLKDGIVSHWQHSPIKRLDYFDTGNKPVDENRTYLININTDQTKIVIWSKKEIELWDLKSHKLLNKKEVQTISGTLFDDGFVTIDKNKDLIKWSLVDLGEIIKIREYYGDGEPILLVNASNRLCILYYHYIYILDSSTFREIKNVRIDNLNNYGISYDNKYFVAPFWGKTIKIEDGEITEDIPWKEIKNRFFRISESLMRFTTSHPLSLVRIRPYYIHHRDFDKNTAVYTFFNYDKKKRLARFFYDNNGEWLLKGMLDIQRHFSASPNIVNYYKSFNKKSNKKFYTERYKKTINLKD